MSIGFILLLAINIFLFISYAAIDLIDSLNERISDIEKERDETKGTS